MDSYEERVMRHNVLLWDRLWGIPWHDLDRVQCDARLARMADSVTGSMRPTPDDLDLRGWRQWTREHAAALAGMVLAGDPAAYQALHDDLMRPGVHDMLVADHMTPPEEDGWPTTGGTPEETLPPMPETDAGAGIGI
ncbi:hypothetical protein [Pseudoscardovia radai]|uniref:hypothetical protein n=1 Tax=Pseudoscardovia radai TaxID=987066 RepID=UPI0039913D6A